MKLADIKTLGNQYLKLDEESATKTCQSLKEFDCNKTLQDEDSEDKLLSP